MGGEMEEWMDTDSLLGSRDMEPALWSPTTERGVMPNLWVEDR